MTRDEIREKIVSIIDGQGLNRGDIPPISDGTELDIFKPDSLDSVELVMRVEETFSIEITDPEAEGLKTIGDIGYKVQKRRPVFTKYV